MYMSFLHRVHDNLLCIVQILKQVEILQAYLKQLFRVNNLFFK